MDAEGRRGIRSLLLNTLSLERVHDGVAFGNGVLCAISPHCVPVWRTVAVSALGESQLVSLIPLANSHGLFRLFHVLLA